MSDFRETLEAAITSEFAAGEPAAPAPAKDAPEAVEQAAPTTPEQTPPAAAAVEETSPAPLALTDKTVVTDPATGEQMTWGELKNARLRHADYTRKSQAVAEERRQVEAMKQQIAAEAEAMRQKAAAAALPELPEDDPYAQRIRAVEAQTQAYLAAQAAREAQIAADQSAAASERLEAQIAKVATEFKLNERETDRVGRELWARMQRGEQTTLEAVAKEYADEREGMRQAAIKEWQDKHRVQAPAAAVVAPAPGLAPSGPPPPHTRERAEYLRDLLVGAQ